MLVPDSDSNSRKKILLVDDSHMGRLARKTVLAEHGYDIITADKPEQVLPLMEAQQVDLVVTKYKMAKTTGVELIAQVREAGYKQPIVLMLGFVDSLSLNEATTGASLVIQKNAHEVNRLVNGVRALLQTRKPPSKAKTTPTSKRRKA